MGHPDLRVQGYSFEERGVRLDDVEHCAAVFPGDGSFYAAAEFMGQILGAVADAENREFAFDAAELQLRGVCVAD